MVIVSQYKDVIINFKNVESLEIGNPLEDDEGKFKILVNTISNNLILAKYKTEERAKEVLQEILKNYEYTDWNYIEQRAELRKVYYMPEK